MFIRKIRLQNIKSYTDQTVAFHEGVNFISGVNGAGKSTIIEAIGYALFDYNPYSNIRDLINYGAKSGTITIDFCANDEREYTVVRKIGSSSLWAVYDLESGGELDLHGARDVREWLKDAMGVDRDISLDQLFQDIVGVPQGTFVGPFLETQAIRKKKFDAILKVEQYREAFNSTARVQSTLSKQIDAVETDLRVMAERVRDYDTAESDLAVVRNKVDVLASKISEMGDRVTTIEKEVAALEVMRARLEQQEGDLKALEATGTALTTRVSELTRDLSKALEALELVKTSQDGYSEFLALEKILRVLEGKRLEKQKLELELNRLQQEIAGLEAQIRENEKNLDRQQKDTALENEAAAAKLLEIKTCLQETGKTLDETKSRQSKVDAWRKAEEELRSLAGRFNETRLEVIAKIEQVRQLTDEEKDLGIKLQIWQETESKALAFHDRDTVYQNARREYAVADNRLKNLEKNISQSRDGLCPFLQSPCQNVDGDLAGYFTGQLEETHSELQALLQKGKALKAERDEAEKAQQELIRLQAYKARLKEVAVQKAKITSEGLSCFAAAGSEPLPEVSHTLKTSAGLVFAGLAECLEIFTQMQTKEGLEEKSNSLEEVLSLLENAVAESRGRRETFEKEVAEEFSQRSATLAKLEADQRNSLNLLERLAERAAIISAEEEKLKETKTGIAARIDKLTAVQKALEGYQNLEQDIGVAREKQSVHRKDYDIYMQNIGEAGKVDGFKAEKDKAALALEENHRAVLELRNERDELKRRFDPVKFTAQKGELDRLRQETATEKQVLLERRTDLQELETRIADMKKTLKKMESLEKEMADSRKALDLLEMVRTVLNNAGPPIAKVYLENLSRAANDLYRQVSRENVELEWREGYEIILSDNVHGQKRERAFKQFSGGEQTTAALAVRLALLKQQSGVRLGFFDEPTSNLDSDRRINLAETIPQVTGGFSQIFIISHDDTFDSMTENVIHIQKDLEAGSRLSE